MAEAALILVYCILLLIVAWVIVAIALLAYSLVKQFHKKQDPRSNTEDE